MKYSKKEREEALATLRELCPPGTTVYTKLNHVSRSGMSRSITPFLVIDGEPYYIAYSVAVIFGQSRDKYDGVRMDGCGMDMGFALVYNLSLYLYPDGFGLKMTKENYPEGIGLKMTKKNYPDYTPLTEALAQEMYIHGYRSHGRNGDTSGWDSNGGYALNQRWI